MAAHMISIARREYSADWTFKSSSSNGATSMSNGRPAVGATSTTSSGASSAVSEAAEPEPLRSGVATMEPNEGRLPRVCCHTRGQSILAWVGGHLAYPSGAPHSKCAWHDTRVSIVASMCSQGQQLVGVDGSEVGVSSKLFLPWTSCHLWIVCTTQLDLSVLSL